MRAWKHGLDHFFELDELPESCPWQLIEVLGCNPDLKTKNPLLEPPRQPSEQAWPAEVWEVLAACVEGWPEQQRPLSDFQPTKGSGKNQSLNLPPY